MASPTLQDRAREHHAAVVAERQAARAQRIEDARPRVEQIVADDTERWLRVHRFEIAWLPGPLTAQDDDGTRWHAHVRFINPEPDDDLELVMHVDLGSGGPINDEQGGWTERDYSTRWLLPVVCAACGDTWARPVGWSLADLGRALDSTRSHECARSRVVIERHLVGGTEGTCDPAIGERLLELEDAGYLVSTHFDEGWLAFVATRSSDDQPF